MITKSITVGGAGCLKAKSAAQLVYKTSEYMSEIYLSKDDRNANGKSLLGVLSMVIAKGDNVTLTVCGPDEDEASQTIETFLMNMPD